MTKPRQATSHSQAWTDALNQTPTLPVDFIGSIREEALNHILAKHFQYDNNRYTFMMSRTFNAGGQDRTFTITIKAAKPIRVDLPPYTTTTQQPDLVKLFDSGMWAELDPPPRSSHLTFPPIPDRSSRQGKAASTNNVRVFCDSLSFTIQWPKLDGTGNWSWSPAPLAVAAEALIELNMTQDGPILKLQVLKIKFDPVQQARLLQEIPKLIKTIPTSERDALSDCEQKFNDLLVIALNIAATTYAPKLVYDINLPVPVVAKTPIKPSLLALNDKIVTVGLTADRTALSSQYAANFQSKLAGYYALLAQDIDAAGGLDALLSSDEDIVRSIRVLRTRLPRSSAYIEEVRQHAKKSPKSKRARASAPGVPDGMGVGASQYVLTRLAGSSMPTPINKCTDWAQVLDVVKGRVCWWVHIFDPAVAISGTALSGQVSIDIGGEIDACVRKFWDCSWSWDCGNLSLALVGRPGIQLLLQSGNGISFYAQAQTGGLALESNLPWPFNKIIEALSGLVIDAIVAIIDLVASTIKFDILLPEFALPKQNTKLQFSDISPFSYTRPSGSSSTAEKTFIGFSVGVTATN